VFAENAIAGAARRPYHSKLSRRLLLSFWFDEKNPLFVPNAKPLINRIMGFCGRTGKSKKHHCGHSLNRELPLLANSLQPAIHWEFTLIGRFMPPRQFKIGRRPQSIQTIGLNTNN
jgi:hypothetical protein